MKPTRGTTLAALVLVAVAAPFTAYAVSADDGGTPPSHPAGHAGTRPDKAAEPDHATGQDRADEASAPGRAHAEAMKAWAHCVAEAASGPKASDAPTPPKQACGDKPMGPGRAKHASDSSDDSPGHSGDHEPTDRGHGHAH